MRGSTTHSNVCMFCCTLVCLQMRQSAMESALQLEVTAHAAAKARQGIMQDSLTAMASDLEQQRAGVA